MTKKLFLSILLIPSVLLLASCGTDYIDAPPGTSPPFVPVDPFMEARIDGVNWTAELIVFTNPGSVLTIDGLGDDGTSIHVQIENYTGLGTYDLQPSDFQTFASWESGEQSYHTYFFGSGTVEITSDDESELGKQVGGTFSFTANSVNPVPTVTVTNGTFVADVLQVPQ